MLPGLWNPQTLWRVVSSCLQSKFNIFKITFVHPSHCWSQRNCFDSKRFVQKGLGVCSMLNKLPVECLQYPASWSKKWLLPHDKNDWISGIVALPVHVTSWSCSSKVGQETRWLGPCSKKKLAADGSSLGCTGVGAVQMQLLQMQPIQIKKKQLKRNVQLISHKQEVPCSNTLGALTKDTGCVFGFLGCNAKTSVLWRFGDGPLISYTSHDSWCYGI